MLDKGTANIHAMHRVIYPTADIPGIKVSKESLFIEYHTEKSSFPVTVREWNMLLLLISPVSATVR